ncbi:multiubiquitin domain-containing protein [Sphingomonas sp. TX0543]|uniref:multiubiquitin domain-containing protein n=1 Tax=unclassified Sphingomonas TaxID=196159 RepID=UPI0010F7D39A|nr:multiubiquitin domain-containing protein [Sphingomonas sp. 3P27F8]
MTMLTTKTVGEGAAVPAGLQHDVNPSTATPAARRAPYYLVGEHERSSARPANVDAGRTLVCVNGRWHGLRGDLATFEQILALAYPDLERPWSTATVTYRRGVATRPAGSLTPGDVVPVADGMLINANVTVLS